MTERESVGFRIKLSHSLFARLIVGFRYVMSILKWNICAAFLRLMMCFSETRLTRPTKTTGNGRFRLHYDKGTKNRC